MSRVDAFTDAFCRVWAESEERAGRGLFIVGNDKQFSAMDADVSASEG